jgi:hypothetical protein
MVETFTPDVCGSRRRQRLALAYFALGALAASALVGAALGSLGGLMGGGLALAAASLALLAAAREAGLLRLPLPQFRRQVPERWRAELPLPVWSLGYGIGLGAGFLTFQPVATFWVACAAAVALGRPLPAALCFAAFGLGRTLMTVSARRGHADATAAVEALVRRRRLLLRANVLALLVCAGLLAAPAAGASRSLGPGLDPAARSTVLARARMDAGSSSVLVQPKGESSFVVPDVAAPAVDGHLLAYRVAHGIKVIDRRTREVVAKVGGPVTKPALDWPLLALVRTGETYKGLAVLDFSHPAAPTERRITRVRRHNDLGRPSLAGGRIAWHVVSRSRSKVFVQVLATGRRRVIAHSEMFVETNPSLTATRVVWVEQRPGSASLRMRRLDRAGGRTIFKVKGRDRRLWTTAVARRTAYVTRWRPSTRASTLVRVNF